MGKKINDTGYVSYRVTPKQKMFLLSLAAQNNKTISSFCREAALNYTDKKYLLSEQESFNDLVKYYLLEQQKMMHIIARLTLFIGGEQTSPEQIMEFFKQCKADAEKLYGNGSAN